MICFFMEKNIKDIGFSFFFFWNSNAKYLWFLELPKLWSRITDRMILFWYDSLKEENYTCMKMLRHSVLFLVNVAICWWQSMHFYGAKIPIIGLYHRARTETDTEFKLISVLVFPYLLAVNQISIDFELNDIFHWSTEKWNIDYLKYKLC